MLSEGHDAALRLALSPKFPGWGYWLSLGATTCWESWTNMEHKVRHSHGELGVTWTWLWRARNREFVQCLHHKHMHVYTLGCFQTRANMCMQHPRIQGMDHFHGSRNHAWLCGGLAKWIYSTLGGISPVTDGFARVRIAPMISRTLGPSSVHMQVPTTLLHIMEATLGLHSPHSWTFAPE